MSDARLKSLYRRLAESGDALAVDADAIVEALHRHGYPDQEGTPLDRIAASPADADILRVALSLAPDAEALSRQVGALRAPQRRVQAPARRWLAMAAGLGGVAVLFSMLGRGPELASTSSAPPSSESIFAVSFESASTADNGAGDAAPIFSGDFDS